MLVEPPVATLPPVFVAPPVPTVPPDPTLPPVALLPPDPAPTGAEEPPDALPPVPSGPGPPDELEHAARRIVTSATRAGVLMRSFLSPVESWRTHAGFGVLDHTRVAQPVRSSTPVESPAANQYIRNASGRTRNMSEIAKESGPSVGAPAGTWVRRNFECPSSTAASHPKMFASRCYVNWPPC